MRVFTDDETAHLLGERRLGCIAALHIHLSPSFRTERLADRDGEDEDG